MRLFIKNLYQKEQKRLLINVLDELEMDYEEPIELGVVKLKTPASPARIGYLKDMLAPENLEIVKDRKEILSEQVKYIVHDMMKLEERPRENYSIYISSRMFLNYTYLANIFSEIQGITIEHFIINCRISKVKELLLYSDLNISEIAEIVHYSSIGHLSNQFKKLTGYSPSVFKKKFHQSTFL